MARWADIAKQTELGRNDIILLPKPFIVKEQNGTITKYEFRKKIIDEQTKEFKYVKVIQKTKITKVRRRISKKSLQRRNLPKFGQCNGVKHGDMEKGITLRQVDDIRVEWNCDKRDKDDDDPGPVFKGYEPDKLLKEILSDSQRKRISGPKQIFSSRKNTLNSHSSRSSEIEKLPTIRILDLPRETSFHDIRDLVRGFNSKKIKLPKDNNRRPDAVDGVEYNRGFAFVQFSCEEDAIHAMEGLNKYPYGTNILHVEWSRNYQNYKQQLKNNPELAELEGFASTKRKRFTNSAMTGGRAKGGQFKKLQNTFSPSTDVPSEYAPPGPKSTPK